MADNLVNLLGTTNDISVPANAKIAVWSLGSFQVNQISSTGVPVLLKDQVAGADQFVSAVLSASATTTVRISASGGYEVWYSIGTDPVVRSGGRLPVPLAPFNATPAAINATATATIAQLMALVITSSTAAAVVITAPTAALIDAATTLAVGDSFDVVLINTGGTNALSISGGTGNTYLGTVSTTAGGMTARFIKTAAGAFTVYRV